MRTLPRPETLLDGLLFPESPRWHEGRLWFSDIHGHRVMTVTPDGEPAVVAECMFRPSGIGFPEDGPPVVVNMLERRLMRLDDGGPTAIADLSGVARGNINDLVLDGHGRAYIGDLDVPEEPGSPRPEGLRPFGRRVVDYFTRGGQPLHAPGWGRLIRVDPDGSSTVVAEELLVPLQCWLLRLAWLLVLLRPSCRNKERSQPWPWLLVPLRLPSTCAPALVPLRPGRWPGWLWSAPCADCASSPAGT